MGPAALHRLTEPRTVSDRFLLVATRLVMWSLAPLALGLCLDVYLVARVVLHESPWPAPLAAALLALLLVVWYVLPRWLRARWSRTAGPGAAH